MSTDDGSQVFNIALLLLGLASVAWCAGLTFIVMRMDSRRKTSSLQAVMASFAILLAGLGEVSRKAKSGE